MDTKVSEKHAVSIFRVQVFFEMTPCIVTGTYYSIEEHIKQEEQEKNKRE
jgi:hypothetical protein